MSDKVELDLRKLTGPLLGKHTVALMVDGDLVCSTSLGEKVAVEISPGEHEIQTFFCGILKRKSNIVCVAVAPDSTAKVTGKYSRLWGNIRLQLQSA